MEQLTVRLYKQVNKAVNEKPMRIRPGKAGTPRSDLSAFAKQRHNYVTNEAEINPHSRFGLINRFEEYTTVDNKLLFKWVDHKQVRTKSPITTNSDVISEEFQPKDVHDIFTKLLTFSKFTPTQAHSELILTEGKAVAPVSCYVLIYYKGAKLAVYVPTITIKAINIYEAFRLKETIIQDKTSTKVLFNVNEIDQSRNALLASLNKTVIRQKTVNTGHYYNNVEYYFCGNSIRKFQTNMSKAATLAGVI